MSLVLLDNLTNSFKYTEKQFDKPTIISYNSSTGEFEYDEPSQHGQIVCSSHGKAFYNRYFGDNFFLTCLPDGTYNPQNFSTGHAYGINSLYQLRPCYWTTSNIIEITFTSYTEIAYTKINGVETSTYKNPKTTASTAIPYTQTAEEIKQRHIENTLYLIDVNVNFIPNGKPKDDYKGADPQTFGPDSQVVVLEAPCTPQRTRATFELTNGTLSFTTGRYDWALSGFWYCMVTNSLGTFDPNAVWRLNITSYTNIEDHDYGDPANWKPYMGIGVIRFIPISAVL